MKRKKLILYIVYVIIEVMLVTIFSIVLRAVMKYFGYNSQINYYNKEAYLSIFATLCSVVFLSTSLMAMLSEKSIYIYWVNIVHRLLIEPIHVSFVAMVIYSFTAAGCAAYGLFVRDGAFVVSGFMFAMIDVIILFFRMISIYYLDEHNKRKIKEELLIFSKNDNFFLITYSCSYK